MLEALRANRERWRNLMALLGGARTMLARLWTAKPMIQPGPAAKIQIHHGNVKVP
jgi:hypothetical protein